MNQHGGTLPKDKPDNDYTRKKNIYATALLIFKALVSGT
jgi:hypothetical protein